MEWVTVFDGVPYVTVAVTMEMSVGIAVPLARQDTVTMPLGRATPVKPPSVKAVEAMVLDDAVQGLERVAVFSRMYL